MSPMSSANSIRCAARCGVGFPFTNFNSFTKAASLGFERDVTHFTYLFRSAFDIKTRLFLRFSEIVFLVFEMYTGVSLSLPPVPEPVGAMSILFRLLRAEIFHLKLHVR